MTVGVEVTVVVAEDVPPVNTLSVANTDVGSLPKFIVREAEAFAITVPDTPVEVLSLELSTAVTVSPTVKLEPSPSLDKAVVEYDKQNDVLVYNVETLIECFIENGMTREEAWDWFNYNTLNTNVQGYPKFTYEKK